MNLLINLALALFVLVSLVMVLVILMQRPKSEGLGAAFGGAFELALACDFIVAAEDAVFRCIEASVGSAPVAGAVQRLAERIGRSRAAVIASS